MKIKLRGEDISIVVLWVIILSVVGLIAYQAFGPLIQAAGNVLAAIVSGGALLIGGILTHALTEIREQRSAQRQRMQENYAKILDRIDKVIRNPNSPDDSFSKIILESWVVGSSAVIKHTQSLKDCKDDETRRALLENIVKAMRADLGLPDTKLILPEGLFPPLGAA